MTDTKKPLRKPWTLPLSKPEEFEMKVAAGCPWCEFDEAEGGLFDHCKDCQQEITAAAYELFVRLRYTPRPPTEGDAHQNRGSNLNKAPQDALVACLTAAVAVLKASGDSDARQLIADSESALAARSIP